MVNLLSLPDDLLLSLGSYTHNIEDYTNLRQTCKKLYDVLGLATPKTILHLAAAQSTTFFRPSPWFLVAATAHQLGQWARASTGNEAELATTMQRGIEGLLDLALAHCGLTMERIRQLHLIRFSIINPVTDVIDRCVGAQWYATPSFWDGGVSDAYTISAEPAETLFHLAIYGELFGPDFETYLSKDFRTRRLSLDTRLEFVKYCIPDFASFHCQKSARDVQTSDSIDPRRAVRESGPYADGGKQLKDNNVALVWVIKSSRWRPFWKEARALAGPDFQEGFADDWWYEAEDGQDWRQRLWESIMVCQGLEGMGMMRPKLRDSWTSRIREWRAKIEELETEPKWIRVGKQATLEYPFLLGDLRICGSGYVLGT
jgi:hypothetical protein